MEGEKWSANVWIWNRKRPDKSKAKDLPKGKKAKSDPRQRLVTFRNKPSSGNVDVYWDSNAPVEGFDRLDEFTEFFREDVKQGFARFKLQGRVESERDLNVNSYDTHVFISVDPTTNEVLYAGAVKNPEQLSKEDKDVDGQIMYVGRRP